MITRDQLIQGLRDLAGNQYLFGEVSDDGFHVSDYDLKRMNQRKLVQLIKKTGGRFSPTDKGIWFRV